jgi:addiction module HigA family antidote
MTKANQGVEKSADRYKVVPRTLSFITRGDEVLLLRGAPTKRIWPDKYNGVGGHVEADEDIYTSAVREMREETGLDIADACLRGILNIDVGQETGIIVFVFTARALGRDARPSPEGTLEWVKQDQIQMLDLVEDLPELLPRVLAMRPDDAPFFARYHYDEGDRLVIAFAEPGQGGDIIRIPTHREPTHPGEMLLEEFLIPMGVTQRQLADAIHVPYQRINEIVNGRRGITPSTALRLGKFFEVSPDFWMNLQLRWDLYHAQQTESSDLKTIEPHHFSAQPVS